MTKNELGEQVAERTGLSASQARQVVEAAIEVVSDELAAGGEVAGYDLGLMSAYIWIGQGLLGAVNLNGTSELAERIRTGDVAVDFARPIDPQAGDVRLAPDAWAERLAALRSRFLALGDEVP